MKLSALRLETSKRSALLSVVRQLERVHRATIETEINSELLDWVKFSSPCRFHLFDERFQESSFLERKRDQYREGRYPLR